MIERLAARTGNQYGKAPGDMDLILGDLATVEPLLRKAADHEIRINISFLADNGVEYSYHCSACRASREKGPRQARSRKVGEDSNRA